MSRSERAAFAPSAEVDAILADFARSRRNLVILTGAGISAESGIPTFRGPEGFWTIGSTVYRPEALATNAAFERMPGEVWGWYLWRRSVCRAAQPNAAHHAVTHLVATSPGRVALVTQNVDGLHRRAGAPSEAKYQIHGDIDRMRCSRGCPGIAPVPSSPRFDSWPRGDIAGEDVLAALRCVACGALMRPHVLWFDESYDEEHFHYDTALALAAEADLLLVVGTSGATHLPMRMLQAAIRHGASVIDVNPKKSPFSDPIGARRSAWLAAAATRILPELAATLARDGQTGPRDQGA